MNLNSVNVINDKFLIINQHILDFHNFFDKSPRLLIFLIFTYLLRFVTSPLCILGSMLKVNPEERLSITELVNQLQEIAAARNVNPKSPITEVRMIVFSAVVKKHHSTRFKKWYHTKTMLSIAHRLIQCCAASFPLLLLFIRPGLEVKSH